MRKTWIASAGLLAMAAVMFGADAPATQPAPPALLAKLAAMPSDIWITRDVATNLKWKFEPNRLKWCMAKFPMNPGTYGTDTFTGTIELIGPAGKLSNPATHWHTTLKTETYTVDGEKLYFDVVFYTPSEPTWKIGDTITVSGPAQFFDFDGFAACANPSVKDEVRRVSVDVHPELGSGQSYAAPIRLKQMGQ